MSQRILGTKRLNEDKYYLMSSLLECDLNLLIFCVHLFCGEYSYTWLLDVWVHVSNSTTILLAVTVLNQKLLGKNTSSLSWPITVVHSSTFSMKCMLARAYQHSLRMYSCQRCGVTPQKRSINVWMNNVLLVMGNISIIRSAVQNHYKIFIELISELLLLLYLQLQSYLDIQGILEVFQSGFKPLHST